MNKKKLKKMILSLVGYGFNKEDIKALTKVKKKDISKLVDDFTS